MVALGALNLIVGFLILWLGIKFGAEPILGVDDPGFFRAFILAAVIFVISWLVNTGLVALLT